MQTVAGRIPLVIDGDAAQVGIESTVIDLTGEAIRILRPGMVSAAAIAAVLPEHTVTAGHDEGVLKSPGQLKRHYAQRAPACDELGGRAGFGAANRLLSHPRSCMRAGAHPRGARHALRSRECDAP